jgi:hypothetical protein
MKLLQNPLEFKVDIPKAIADASSVYLSKSNLVIRWFEENYEKCDEVISNKPSVIKLKDMYDEFQITHVWKEMSKKEKRDLTYKSFIELFTNRKEYREEFKILIEQNRLHFRNILIGYKSKSYETEIICDNTDCQYDLIIN